MCVRLSVTDYTTVNHIANDTYMCVSLRYQLIVLSLVIFGYQPDGSYFRMLLGGSVTQFIGLGT